MTSPAYCLPQAVDNSAQVSAQLQLTTAEELITDVGSYVPLSIAWSGQLIEDENTYYMDTMASNPTNPDSAALTAKDYAIYTQDSAAMTRQTGALSNLIQSDKTAVSLETNNLKQQYSWISSLTQFTQIYCMLLRIKQ